MELTPNEWLNGRPHLMEKANAALSLFPSDTALSARLKDFAVREWKKWLSMPSDMPKHPQRTLHEVLLKAKGKSHEYISTSSAQWSWRLLGCSVNDSSALIGRPAMGPPDALAPPESSSLPPAAGKEEHILAVIDDIERTACQAKVAFAALGPQVPEEAFQIRQWVTDVRDSLNDVSSAVQAVSRLSRSDFCGPESLHDACCPAHSACSSIEGSVLRFSQVHKNRAFTLLGDSSVEPTAHRNYYLSRFPGSATTYRGICLASDWSGLVRFADAMGRIDTTAQIIDGIDEALGCGLGTAKWHMDRDVQEIRFWSTWHGCDM